MLRLIENPPNPFESQAGAAADETVLNEGTHRVLGQSIVDGRCIIRFNISRIVR
jgi:hypothetical protein